MDSILSLCYFGIPVFPQPGSYRLVMMYLEAGDTPNIIYARPGKRYMPREEFEKAHFYDHSNVCRVEKPISIEACHSLYVDSTGTLFLTRGTDPTAERKEIGKYDRITKQFLI